VTRPSQDFREIIVSHSAESSRTGSIIENPYFNASLRIPAQSRFSVLGLGTLFSARRPNLPEPQRKRRKGILSLAKIPLAPRLPLISSADCTPARG
ncbi:MAG: hypothetical protein WBC04_02950, partial [Candidatus Acidiferrales bacterium]